MKVTFNSFQFWQNMQNKKKTSCKNTIYILYDTTPHTKSLQYGRMMEVIARKKTEIIGQSIQICGLVIDPQIPYLAASPGILK